MDGYSGWRAKVSRGMLPLLAIHVVNEFHRSGSRPPVTAGLVIVNTLIYLRPGALHRILPTINQVGFNPHLIVKYGELRRFFLSPLYHLNEPHLFFNMMSLLWKGIHLETSMGSVEFASMVATLLGLSQGITLFLAKCSLDFFDYKAAYYHQYGVGFSGVLFALKVVLNSQSDESDVQGLIIPARYAVWAELILIQLVAPEVSFLGHLGGILAGLLYLRLMGSLYGPDPLTALIGNVVRIVSWPLRVVRGLFRSWRPRFSGRGAVGRRLTDGGVSSVWRCPTCTFENSGWIDVCEMCSTEREGRGFSSMRSSSSNNSNVSGRSSSAVDVNEVRRRRLERFDR